MNRTSAFIALDGVDGSGNTTHSKLLSEWIGKSLGFKVLLTKEPTTKPVGSLLRRYLTEGSVPSATDALLFAADRIEHVEKIIKPAMAEGRVVISDRYLESSIAYQSSQGLPIEWLLSINKYAIKPSLNIILEIDPDKSLSRKPKLTDKFEDSTFLRKVRSAFLMRAKSENFPVISTSGPIEEAQERIRVIVKSFLQGVIQKT
jgi:dTMP kinase